MFYYLIWFHVIMYLNYAWIFPNTGKCSQRLMSENNAISFFDLVGSVLLRELRTVHLDWVYFPLQPPTLYISGQTRRISNKPNLFALCWSIVVWHQSLVVLWCHTMIDRCRKLLFYFAALCFALFCFLMQQCILHERLFSLSNMISF